MKRMEEKIKDCDKKTGVEKYCIGWPLDSKGEDIPTRLKHALIYAKKKSSVTFKIKISIILKWMITSIRARRLRNGSPWPWINICWSAMLIQFVEDEPLIFLLCFDDMFAGKEKQRLL